MSDKGQVVIVGAGIAGGVLALKLLAKRRDFIIINPVDYLHVNFAAVRAVAVPGFAEKTMVPLEPAFGERFKKGKVVKVVPNENQDEQPGGKVVLESGEEVEYRYLVIATGTTTQWPIKLHAIEKEEALNMYHALLDKVKEAKRIALVGGGATGIETAVEYCTAYPDKEITLIHNSQSLLTDKLTERSQQFLQNQLKTQFKINLVLGERVSNLDELENGAPGTVKTDKETSIEADMVFKFVGVKLNTEAYKDGLESAMNERGALKVDNFFQVEGFPNIFALGDVTSLEEPKIGALAMEHGEIMAKTIFNLDAGKSPAKYKPDNFALLTAISLGPTSAFARTKGDWKVPVFFMKKLKCKHLFTDKWWKDLKQKLPS